VRSEYRFAVAAALIILSLAEAHSQSDPIPLWTGEVPGAQGQGPKHTPTITPYLPEDRTAISAAIIVCPGGGYGGLAMDHEGKQVGEWLSREGIAAFVLRYRHGPEYGHPIPLTDIQRAIRTVRAQASQWKIDPERIGILGFSAGGHLVATASTKFDSGDPASSDSIENQSSRPDFAILGYPVITMRDPHTHLGSRKNLLGSETSEEQRDALSAELHVTANTPPSFLIHTTDDRVVPVENSLLYYQALLDANVSAEIHIFQKGSHGLGLAPDMPDFGAWPSLCIRWLQAREILRTAN